MSKVTIFLLTVASGSGKTTIMAELYSQCAEYVVIDLGALHPCLNN